MPGYHPAVLLEVGEVLIGGALMEEKLDHLVHGIERNIETPVPSFLSLPSRQYEINISSGTHISYDGLCYQGQDSAD